MARVLIVGCGCRGRALARGAGRGGPGRARHHPARRRPRPRSRRREPRPWWPIRTGWPRWCRTSAGVSVGLLAARERLGPAVPASTARGCRRCSSTSWTRRCAGSSTRRRAPAAELLARARLVREAGERWRLPVGVVTEDPGRARALARGDDARRCASVLGLDAQQRHERERDRGDHEQRRQQQQRAGGHGHDARQRVRPIRVRRGLAGGTSVSSAGPTSAGSRPNAATSPFCAWISRRSCSTQRGQLRRCTSSRAAPGVVERAVEAVGHQRLGPQAPAASPRAGAPSAAARSARAARTRPRSGSGMPSSAAAAGAVAAREHHERERPRVLLPQAAEASARHGPRRGRDRPARPVREAPGAAARTPRRGSIRCLVV